MWVLFNKTYINDIVMMSIVNQLEFVVPRTHLVTYGDRAFSAAASANLWNYIPEAIRLCNTVTTFKISIKTYLFNLAYPINQWFYQTQNILCWQVLLIKCDGCGYIFLSKFYPMYFIRCSVLLRTAEKVVYKFDITLHYQDFGHGIPCYIIWQCIVGPRLRSWYYHVTLYGNA